MIVASFEIIYFDSFGSLIDVDMIDFASDWYTVIAKMFGGKINFTFGASGA